MMIPEKFKERRKPRLAVNTPIYRELEKENVGALRSYLKITPKLLAGS